MALIVIEVSGGCVTDVTGLPPGVAAVVHDYDRENYDEEQLADSPDSQYAILPIAMTEEETNTESLLPASMVDARQLSGVLRDTVPAVSHETAPIPFIVEYSGNTIVIGFRGYGEKTATTGYGRPIHIEHYDGKLTLRVWGDINSEDPTHVIDLHGAQESLYEDSRDKVTEVRCPQCNDVAACEGPVSMEKDYYCPNCNHHFSEEEANAGG